MVVETTDFRVKRVPRDNPDSLDSRVFPVQRVSLESPEEHLTPRTVPRERRDSRATLGVMEYPASKERWATWEEKDRRA